MATALNPPSAIGLAPDVLTTKAQPQQPSRPRATPDKEKEKAISFLQRRTPNLLGRDRAQSMVISQDQDPFLAVPPGLLDGVMRRKSLDVSSRLDSPPTKPKRDKHFVSLSRSDSAGNNSQQRRSPFSLPLLFRSASSTTSSSPSQNTPPPSSSSQQHPALSHRSSSTSVSGQTLKLTKPQMRFSRAFPELTDVFFSAPPAPTTLSGQTQTASPILTPPLTPPESCGHLGHEMATSNTLHTIVSSTSSTSTSTLLGPGHFNDFACALEREILWQGTLYVTPSHICFYGKHFGKAVRIMVDYADLVSVEKEKKMGVFPNSIRIKVRASKMGDHLSADELSPADSTTKDYVFTSFLSRDQAFGDIEAVWSQYRLSFLKSNSSTTTSTPAISIHPSSTPDGNHTNSEYFDIDPSTKASVVHLRNRRKTVRSYSVISNDAFSSTENLEGSTIHHPSLTSKDSSSIRSKGKTSSEIWSGDEEENVRRNSIDIASLAIKPSGRRGSLTSTASSEKRTSGSFTEFFQRKTSLRRKKDTSSTLSLAPPTSNKAGYQEILASPSLPAASVLSVQGASSTASIRSETSRSLTPPPLLLSPSMTTTKVSQTSSTVGSNLGIANQIKNKSSCPALDAADDPVVSASQANMDILPPISPMSLTPPTLNLPSASAAPAIAAQGSLPAPIPAIVSSLPKEPVSCGCARHFKNAILNTVVPLPLHVCYEILFSASGLGKGDKIGCETHRIKDGSTEIKIAPWEGAGANSPWAGKTRKIEYSVSFKIPMLKTSTACFETQQVIKHSEHVIIIHSESKTPNVPYGENFSTVNQICMTWESQDKCRIRCSTEVSFKKSIMWASKVEAGSLEGSGGYYREFVRQLVELAPTIILPLNSGAPLDTNEANVVWQQVLSTNERPSPTPATPVLTIPSKDATLIEVVPPAPIVDQSPARSLLTQQYQREQERTKLRMTLEGQTPTSSETNTTTKLSGFIHSLTTSSSTQPDHASKETVPVMPMPLEKTLAVTFGPTEATSQLLGAAPSSIAPVGKAKAKIVTSCLKPSNAVGQSKQSGARQKVYSGNQESTSGAQPAAGRNETGHGSPPIFKLYTTMFMNLVDMLRYRADTSLGVSPTHISSQSSASTLSTLAPQEKSLSLAPRPRARGTRTLALLIILNLVVLGMNLWNLFSILWTMIAATQLQALTMAANQPFAHPSIVPRGFAPASEAFSEVDAMEAYARWEEMAWEHKVSKVGSAYTLLARKSRQARQQKALAPLQIQAEVLKAEILELVQLFELTHGKDTVVSSETTQNAA